MKKLLFLFLLLPCIVQAQYTHGRFTHITIAGNDTGVYNTLTLYVPALDAPETAYYPWGGGAAQPFDTLNVGGSNPIALSAGGAWFLDSINLGAGQIRSAANGFNLYDDATTTPALTLANGNLIFAPESTNETITGAFNFVSAPTESGDVVTGSANNLFSSGDDTLTSGNNFVVGLDINDNGVDNNFLFNESSLELLKSPTSGGGFEVMTYDSTNFYNSNISNSVPILSITPVGTIVSDGAQLTTDSGRILNGGNGWNGNWSDPTGNYTFQGNQIPSSGYFFVNVVAFSQSTSYPNQSVFPQGTYFDFAPSDTTGEGGNPIEFELTGSGIFYAVPALSSSYSDSYDVLGLNRLNVDGQIGGVAFSGYLFNQSAGSNIYVLTDMVGNIVTTAVLNGDYIDISGGTYNASGD